MPLTDHRKQELRDILERTAQLRSSFAERTIPDAYKANLGQVTQAEYQVPTPYGPVRCIVTTAKDKADPCPVHINMHGGGFYYPHTEDDSLYCAHIAARVRGITVDIDYALSHQQPFPAALEQSYAACGWVFGQLEAWGGDKGRVSIGGHSAGGNLSAAICLRAVASGDFSFCLQVLDYPGLDMATHPHDKPGGYKLEMPLERLMTFNEFLFDGDFHLARNPMASPALATDPMLKGQPPTLIITTESCNFRFEGERYGNRLAAQGTEVSMRRFLHSRHGFTVRMVDEWQEAQELIIRKIAGASLRA